MRSIPYPPSGIDLFLTLPSKNLPLLPSIFQTPDNQNITTIDSNRLLSIKKLSAINEFPIRR